MIHHQEHPLTDQQRQQLRVWLNRSESRIYLDWVSSRAALLTAEAGMKLVSTEQCDKIEAPKIAEEARRYQYAFEVFNECRSEPEETLSFVTLQPKPSTTS